MRGFFEKVRRRLEIVVAEFAEAVQILGHAFLDAADLALQIAGSILSQPMTKLFLVCAILYILVIFV